MDFFTWRELQEICGGEWILPPPSASTAPAMMTDDSRLATQNSLFVAVDGREHGLPSDGHNYISQAANAGCSAIFAQRRPAEEVLSLLREKGCGLLLVENGLRAFQAIAHAWRKRAGIPIVGVTGSCGKTSTKEMVAAVLENKFPNGVLKTIGNTNNYFGVPRNLLRISDETRAAVIETGSNHPGEIHTLAEMVSPNVAVISCIGAAHLEFFHDLNGVAEEKGDIFQSLPPDGVCVFPYTCAGKEILLRHVAGRKALTFGTEEEADIRVHYDGFRDGAFHLLLQSGTDSAELSWAIPGECQALNAASAAAVGLAFGMTLKQCAESLRKCVLPGARMAVEQRAGITWSNDAYNANPTSMLEALKAFKDTTGDSPNNVLILGDMLELGQNSLESHKTTLREARNLFPQSRILTVGKFFAVAAEPYAEIQSYPDVSALLNALTLPTGTTVFLKSSHSIGLDALPSLYEKRHS